MVWSLVALNYIFARHLSQMVLNVHKGNINCKLLDQRVSRGSRNPCPSVFRE